MATFPVVLCGGAGTRLWPTSRPERPKQFAPLLGPRSTFQETVRRVAALRDVDQIIVVAGAGHTSMVDDQIDQIGCVAQLLIEPAGRESAAAVAAAAHWIARRDPAGVAVVVAADHDLPDHIAFSQAVDIAVGAAQAGAIVTFGVTPTSASSAYGYIRPGEPAGETGALNVDAFVEKPDEDHARSYLAAGYLWNSGNFVFRVDVFLSELEAFAPAINAAARAAVDEGGLVNGRFRLGHAFLTAPKISVDYAVLEPSCRTVVVPVRYEWSDLGAWDAVLAASSRDAKGNAVSAGVELVDCTNTLARVDGAQRLAVVGVDNLAVVVERDAILVCDLAASQSVKRVPASTPSPPQDRFALGVASLKRELATLARYLDLWWRTNALPLWATVGFDRPTGLFQEAIGLDGRPVAGPHRLRVQARQIYVYARAGLSGWEGPWRALVEDGVQALRVYYQRPDGAFRSLVGEGGQILDDRASLYDQAFVLFALATVVRADSDKAHAATARALLDGPLQAMRHANGGFRETMEAAPFQSNPHMHLLEAAMAWEELDAGQDWARLADELVSLAISRFVDPDIGWVLEFFDADWAAAPDPEGRLVLPGHQFEWCWLLERWATLRTSPEVGGLARGLFHLGARGVDQARQVAVDALLDDGSVYSASARLWPQTERLKAALLLARRQDADEHIYLGAALSAALALKRYFGTDAQGLWRDSLDHRGRFIDQPAPASSFYHISSALAELRACDDYLARSDWPAQIDMN